MLDKEKMLSHIQDKDDLMELSNILDKAELALKRHQPVSTNFLNPYHLHLAKPILENIADLKVMVFGGYKRAERNRIALMPDYYINDLVDSPIALLNIKGQFKFQRVSHRDFLGALLGLGIKREMVGDLLVNKDACQAIVAEEIKDYIIMNLDQVHKIGVKIEEFSFDRINVEEEKVKIIKSTVSSLRLDSVASSGFSTSRNKMSKEIGQGKVKVNWKVIDNPAHSIDLDDIISIRGRGRVEIDEVLGESNRGRIKLNLKRYI